MKSSIRNDRKRGKDRARAGRYSIRRLQYPFAWLSIAAATAAGCAGAPELGRVAEWRDYVFYMIVTDRFADGDRSNNALNGPYAPENPNGIHGGDLRGIEEKLPYLEALGINAIWITPVQKNFRGAYHGYWIQDFLEVDPHLGTMEDLRRLIRSAHARGISVFLDVVCNHFGPLSHPEGGAHAWNPEGYRLVWNDSSALPSPAFFRDLTLYHPYGDVKEWTDPYQVLGELPGGLDDLRTELPAVRETLFRIWRWWMEQTGCDGFRVDTVKHVEIDFWHAFIAAMKEHARRLGRGDFFIFGEVFEYDDATCASYTRPDSLGRPGFDAVLNFSMAGSLRNVFAQGEDPSFILRSAANLSLYHPASRPHLLSFLDNHDIPRFLHLARGDTAALRAALTFLATSEGIPILYYGTEQGFLGGESHGANREDMFGGAWKGANPHGDSFDTHSELFRFTQSLLQLRRDREVLRRGQPTFPFVDTARAVFVLRRSWKDDVAFTACNLSGAPQRIRLASARDLLDWESGARYAQDGASGEIEIVLAPRTATILLATEHPDD